VSAPALSISQLKAENRIHEGISPKDKDGASACTRDSVSQLMSRNAGAGEKSTKSKPAHLCPHNISCVEVKNDRNSPGSVKFDQHVFAFVKHNLLEIRSDLAQSLSVRNNTRDAAQRNRTSVVTPFWSSTSAGTGSVFLPGIRIGHSMFSDATSLLSR
jgi:hypothetical protein